MALWTPAQITTALWLDADDSSTLTLDGSGNVEQWNDKSGNESHATQTNSFNRPGYLNNRLIFTGSEWIDSTFSQSQPLAVLVVASTTANSGASGSRQFVMDSSSSTDGARKIIALRGNQVNKPSLFADNWQAHSFSTTTDLTLIYALFDRADSVIGVNGHDEGLADVGTRQLTAGLRLGSHYLSTNVDRLSGSIAEFIVLDSEYTTLDKEKTEGYLAHKWGIAGSLPADHPYKSAAPPLALASGNARINETTASRLVVAYDTTLTEIGRDVPDDTTTPPGDYEIVASGPVYLQSHAFDPSKWQGIRAVSTTYAVGDIVFSEAAGTGLVLECTTAGTTAGTAPTFDATVGNTTSDGTAVWTTLGVVEDLAPKTNFYVVE